LSKDEIRVRYSGFVVFAAQVLSIATGLIYTLLLARDMTQQQYGIWANIFDLVGYFTLVSGLFPFWATRFVARGKEGTAKTGLLTNLILALVSMAVYLPVISLVPSAFHISAAYLILYVVASLQIINIYMIGMMESCLRAEKPQAVGYGLLIEEVCKVSLAFLLIVGLHQLFLGAMLSLIGAASIQALYYTRLLVKDLRQRIRWNYLKEWLKGSTANFYNSVGNQLAAFVFILLFLYGGQAARGDYQAAATFANIVGYSSFLAFALYPELLAKNSLKDVAFSFKTVLMFAIPMAAIVITMSKSFLTVLKVDYGVASPILVVLTLDTVVLLISQFYSTLILGIERLDQEAKVSLNELVRSKMFKVFTLPYLQAAIVLPTAYYVLTQSATSDSVQAVVYVTTINICAHMATFLGLYAIMRKSVRIAVPWRSIGKYLFASAATVIVLFLLPQPTTILLTLGKAAAGVATYAALLLTIDVEARELVGLIWREIKDVFGGFGQKRHARS
jgi:O-antigen/teichoic acid export membrane protein